MPAYRCPRCGAVVEGDPATLRCPTCGYPDAAPASASSPRVAPWPAPPSPSPLASPPPAAPRPARRLAGLASSLAALLIAGAAASLLALVFPVPGTGSFLDHPGRSLLGAAASALGLATVIVFCVWLHRACANAHAANPAAGVRPGWAVGSFFVPIVHLWVPFLEVRKAWRAHGPPGESLFSAWMAAWTLRVLLAYGVGLAIAQGVVRAALEAARTGQDPATIVVPASPLAVALQVTGTLVAAIAAALLVGVARRWSAWQDAHPQMAATQAPPPPGTQP
ncbi:MAG: hypothetical protein QOI63_733 [Thermoplasmata archaeon]|jgi:hypothetical protein|nr:hypothetical protein [Thermoplasmata archaeon]